MKEILPVFKHTTLRLLAMVLFGLFGTGLQAQTCPANLGTTVSIASLPYNGVALTTCGAGNDITSANATICGSSSYYGGEDLVFTFTPTTSGSITLSISSTSTWVGMMLYNGCPFIGQGGACVAQVQSSSGSPTMNAAVTAGVTYYLVVDTWPTPTCIPSFNLTITAPAAPPACPGGLGSFVNVTLPYNGVGLTNCGAGNDLTSSNTTVCGSSSYYGGEDQVYIFTPTASGPSTITFTSSSSWVGLMLYSGCPLAGAGGSCVAQAQSSAGNQTLNVTLTAGVTYYLIVDSWPSPTCHPSYNLSITAPGGFDPCSSIAPLSCGAAVSTTQSGTGVWDPSACGFSTPGQEKLYSFTPAASGTATLQVNSTSATGYIDYFFKAASGGCNSSGWTCIKDVFSTGSWTFSVTGGVTYYLLLDPETTSSVTQNFQINCPAAFDPCTSVTALSCGTAVSTTQSGSGAWNTTSCGFSTPGQEKLYSFTPTNSGTATLQVNSTSATGYIDYFFKAASGGCNSSGWTCIKDVFSAGSWNFTVTGGVTYYLLLDPETTGSVTQNFQINCPTLAPPCVTTPTSPTNGQTNICPSPTQTLSWPASPGAISYDVYFGTTTTPLFLQNTTATSLTVNTPTNGTYYWQILPRNASGPASGCNIWSFTKIDVTPPTITCPASVTANNSPATACSAVVFYGSIFGSDACGAPSLALQSGLPSGSTFPVGVNTVVYRATDNSNNTATCSFTVTVNDVTPPSITCPASLTANNDPGECGAIRNYSTPSASDNCGVQAVTLLSGLPSGSFFPVGTTVNTWRARDAANNSSTCSFSITIKDAEAPVVTCPPAVVKPNAANECGRQIDNLGNALITDNCIGLDFTNNSPGYFPVGTTIVTYIGSDNGGNSSSCTQSVTVQDVQFPYITCPSLIQVETDQFDCAATVSYAATATDNCDGYIVEYSTDPNSQFEIGLSSVIATVTDASGNSVNCTIQIKVNPREEVCNDFDDDCDGYVDEAQDWKRIAKRLAKDGGAFDEYGLSVDIDGEWAIVGSNKKNTDGQSFGAAYVLHRSNGVWTNIQRLQPDPLPSGTQFGYSVAIDGNTVAVGAPSDDEMAGNAGAVYIYQQDSGNPNSWLMVKKLSAGDAAQGDNFGWDVDLDGDWMIAGAPLHDGAGADAGSAYAFGRNEGGADNWGQAAQLAGNGVESQDHFGWSVAISGTQAVVGAPGDDDKGPDAGAAYRFNGAANWAQTAKLLGAQTSAGDNFGRSVAASGNYAFIGAPYNDLGGDDAGAAFLFNQIGQTSLVVNYNAQDGDNFGATVSIDGDYAVVGAPGANPFGDNSGKAYVYLIVNQGLALVGQLTDGGGQANDALASSVAISNRIVLVGIPQDDNGSELNRGSVYFYEGLCVDDNTAVRPRTDEDDQVLLKGLDVQCFPVPFSDNLTIMVNSADVDVQISILNALGQEISQLNQGNQVAPGQYQWQAGKAQPGMYFVRVSAGGLVQTKPVVLARN
ncbi:MAG: HYR domain-containing protein [Saprospiraceae bacterium]|nr:HYR domain-containing protein [Saprospiraceae bacterium]